MRYKIPRPKPIHGNAYGICKTKMMKYKTNDSLRTEIENTFPGNKDERKDPKTYQLII